MNWSQLFKDLQQVVTDPTADPRKTALAAGMALLVFLAAVVLALILLPAEEPEEEEDHEEKVEESRPRPGWVKWVVWGTVGFLVVLVVSGVIYGDHWTRRSSMCGSCHVVAPAVETWQASTHAKVGCVSCHSSPGLLGGVETRVRGVSDLVAELSSPKTIKAAPAVNQESCMACHAKMMTGVAQVKRIRVRHSDFAREVPCQQCHGQVGHQAPGDIQGGLRSGVMTTCADCHDGRRAPSRCDTCHVGDLAQISGGITQFAKIELGAPTTCEGCHSLTGCTNCHGIQMPHPPNWGDPKQHARSGAFDKTLCVRCHDAQCSPCHQQIHDSHPPNWEQEHKLLRFSDGVSCTSGICHRQAGVKNLCSLCHSSPPA